MAGNLIENLQGIGGLVSGLGDAAKGIREAITGKAILDPGKQAELELKAQELIGKAQEIEASVALAQSDTNKVEAASSSLFVSGWRPFLGWTLSTCAGVYFLPRFVLGMTAWSILAWKAIAAGALALPPLPDMGWGDLATLLMGLLGLGFLRTAEKVKGVAGQH